MATYTQANDLTNITWRNGDIINLDYQGAAKTFALQPGVYQFECWGAQGGSHSAAGGYGGYTIGTLTVPASSMTTTFYAYVGGVGANASGSSGTGAGGWNGGGSAGSGRSGGPGGGGASDIRTTSGVWSDTTSLRSRIMVAGGGGGAGGNGDGGGAGGDGTAGGVGGYGGQSSGSSGAWASGAAPGSGGGAAAQTGGGLGASSSTSTGDGSGVSNDGTYYRRSGGGGGGGYYGGGGGASGGRAGAGTAKADTLAGDNGSFGIGGGTQQGNSASSRWSSSAGGGGGGSSFVSGHPGCNAINSSGTHTGTANHFSGYVFTGTNMIGNQRSGNGFIRITVINVYFDTTPATETTGTVGNTTNITNQVTGTIFNIPYTGTVHQINFPMGLFKIECWGAQGGRYATSSAVGRGGYTCGVLRITAPKTLYAYTGQQPTSRLGGWNGGGNGSNNTVQSGGGGGASDIRVTLNNANSRIMVAAGGGGFGGSSTGGTNGQGGGLTGTAGNGSTNMPGGNGGTQTAGGTVPAGATGKAGLPGAFNLGGSNVFGYPTAGAGGGGGGYYGGAAGGSDANDDFNDGQGGGGSSFISGYMGCNARNASSVHLGHALHNSGLFFYDGIMASGAQSMPNPTGTGNITGNPGNGYIRITIIEIFNFTPTGPVVFNYTGSVQQINLKPGRYTMECWGAQGGNSVLNSDNTGAVIVGGLGAYTKGTITLTKEQTLYIYVGQRGQIGNNAAGGWNGGGRAGTVYQFGGSGGGASDIRLVEGNWDDITSLRSRIMVAGAGAGASNWTNAVPGGAGGGLTGISGLANFGSTTLTISGGGKQNGGGIAGGDSTGGLGSSGSFGKGGNPNGHGSGGGAGYYGGGGGGWISGGVCSGGGGSSFVSGHTGCNAVNISGTHTGSLNHFSGLNFTNTIMTDAIRVGDGLVIITPETIDMFYSPDVVKIFDCPGIAQPITLGPGEYKIECWGAQGGGGRQVNTDNVIYSGGFGSYVCGIVKIDKLTTLYAYVGGAGNPAPKETGGYGGWNGGGRGGWDTDEVTLENNGWKEAAGGGGGATDIRLVNGAWNNANSLRSRIIVAAGGGGSCSNPSGRHLGSNGGTLVGNAQPPYTNIPNQTSINFGFGGDGFVETNSTQNFGGGGGHGSGWYGGSSGTTADSNGGSGGSCYISGHTGCNSVTSETSSVHTGKPNHYSGIIFAEGEMIAGGQLMPNITTEELTIGKNGNGCIKITLLPQDSQALVKIDDTIYSHGIYELDQWHKVGKKLTIYGIDDYSMPLNSPFLVHSELNQFGTDIEVFALNETSYLDILPNYRLIKTITPMNFSMIKTVKNAIVNDFGNIYRLFSFDRGASWNTITPTGLEIVTFDIDTIDIIQQKGLSKNNIDIIPSQVWNDIFDKSQLEITILMLVIAGDHINQPTSQLIMAEDSDKLSIHFLNRLAKCELSYKEWIEERYQ